MLDVAQRDAYWIPSTSDGRTAGGIAPGVAADVRAFLDGTFR